MCEGCNILGIYVTHLILETLGDTDDQVVLLQSAQSFLPCQYRDSRVCATYNQGADSAESGDALAGTVVELDLDEVLLGLFQS
jgi:hypothetical protein